MEVVSTVQLQSDRFNWRHVGRLVVEIHDADLDVDDRLGDKTGNRGRPDMLDAQSYVAQRGAESLTPPVEPIRPFIVVIDDLNQVTVAVTAIRRRPTRPDVQHDRASQRFPLCERQLVSSQTVRSSSKVVKVDDRSSWTLLTESTPCVDGGGLARNARRR